MHIEANIPEQHMAHFKSQLIQYEVKNGDVQVLFDGGGYQDRHHLMTCLVRRSFADRPVSRSLRFWVFTGDNRPTNIVNGQPLFSISGPRMQSHFVIPDPHILKWPQINVEDFAEYCEDIRLSSLNKPEKAGVIWRGSTAVHPVREFIANECGKLNNPKLDIKNTPPEVGNESFVSMKDITKWAILCDMPGQGFSGRLKYLLHAHRPVIVFERCEWDAVTMLLEPGLDFISCPPDIQVFTYTVDKILTRYEDFLASSVPTARLISKLTERSHVSNLLVAKILFAS